MAKYLLSIGGTGMRCTEAFVQLCAMGMFDGEEFNILLLDTDKNNGNFDRLKKCISCYTESRGDYLPQNNTFFSAKLNCFEFSPDYSTLGNRTYKEIVNYNTASDQEKNVINLLFSDKVQDFQLLEGYRAQTQLGSLLMHKAIIEEINRVHNTVNERSSHSLYKFIKELQSDNSARVFAFGSIFGGTGASSIPIIPQALDAAAKVINPASNILASSYFGASVITPYFSFNPPSPADLKKHIIIADSTKFAINSQAALMFYNSDSTIRSTYQQFYLLGSNSQPVVKTVKDDDGAIKLGGLQQENCAHNIELLAAGAAYNFFGTDDTSLDTHKNASNPEYIFRQIGPNGEIDFKDIINNDEFGVKFGRFLFSGYMMNVSKFGTQVSSGYHNIDNNLTSLINFYNGFMFGENGYMSSNSSTASGWLKQLYHSSINPDKYLFDKKMFSGNWADFKPNKELYSDYCSVPPNQRSFSARWSNAFDKFKDKFKNTPSSSTEIDGLLKRIYDTVNNLY